MQEIQVKELLGRINKIIPTQQSAPLGLTQTSTSILHSRTRNPFQESELLLVDLTNFQLSLL